MASSSRPSPFSFPLPPQPPSPPPPAAPASSPPDGPPLLQDLHILAPVVDLPPLSCPTASARPPSTACPRKLPRSSAPPSPHDADAIAALCSGGSPSSTPVAATVSAQPAPFLAKTYDLVDDEETDAVISWNANSNAFIVWDSQALCKSLLPRYFRHANFSSFIRQLNIYGFRKVDPDRWEFANFDFVKGKRHLLGCIHRKKPSNMGAHRQLQYSVGSPSLSLLASDSHASLEVEKFGIRAQLYGLKHEVCRLGQQLQHAEGKLEAMYQRVQTLKSCEQHMMAFMLKAVRDPAFLSRHSRRPCSDTAEMPKRQKLTGSLPFSAGGDGRTADMGDAPKICDAPIPDDPQASSGSGMLVAEFMELCFTEMEAANPIDMQVVPCPFIVQKGRIEPRPMMAPEDCTAQRGQADQSNSSPSATLESNQSANECGRPAACVAGSAPLCQGLPKIEWSSVPAPPNVGKLRVKTEQQSDHHVYHKAALLQEGVNPAAIPGDCVDYTNVFCWEDLIDGFVLKTL